MRRARYASLEQHPQQREVQAVLTRLPTLSDTELRDLADQWVNNPTIGKARAKALSPDTPLVLDALRTFDDLATMYADDLDPETSTSSIPVNRVAVALKAARDAVAATIARPVLSRREFKQLIAPWSAVVGTGGGPVETHPNHWQVEDLLTAVRGLADRCHAPQRADAFERVLIGAITRDRNEHSEAVDSAYHVAIRARRHRSWALVREQAVRSLEASCRTCPSLGFDGYERERVADLCADAACGLLVADLVEPRLLDVLIEPLAGLIPNPRPPLGA